MTPPLCPSSGCQGIPLNVNHWGHFWHIPVCMGNDVFWIFVHFYLLYFSFNIYIFLILYIFYFFILKLLINLYIMTGELDTYMLLFSICPVIFYSIFPLYIYESVVYRGSNVCYTGLIVCWDMRDRTANNTIHMYTLCEYRGERHLDVCNAYPHSNSNSAGWRKSPPFDIWYLPLSAP